MEFTLNINGKSWPARHTLRVAIQVHKRSGGLGELIQDQDKERAMENMAWLASEQIRAGEKYNAILEGREPQATPSAEEILDTLDYADLPVLLNRMLEIANKDEPTVNAEAGGKNAEATSDA